MSWTEWKKVEGDGLEFDEIIYEKKFHSEMEGGVARVSINKPEKYNTLTLRTVDQMFRAFYDAGHDTSIGVIVVAAVGKHFGAGGDVDWETWGLREAFYNRYPHNRLIRLSRKPVIAAVQGYCLGGGNEINMVCDLTIASESSKFGQVGPTVGSIPVLAGTQYLPRNVGDKKAKEIVFLCERYSAEEAREMGWINKAVPDEKFEEEVQAWCERILQMSPQSLRVAKLSINFESDQLTASFNHGIEILASTYGGEELQEGMNAFLEKRKPEFNKFRK